MSDRTDRIERECVGEWRTTREIAERSGATRAVTSRKLTGLVRFGLAERRVRWADMEGRGLRLETEWRRVA